MLSRLRKLVPLFQQRGYFIAKNVAHIHTTKIKQFPRKVADHYLHNDTQKCSNEYETFEDDLMMSEEDFLYKDLEINNLGSAIGAKIWHSLPTETLNNQNNSTEHRKGHTEEQKTYDEEYHQVKGQSSELNADHSFDDYKSDKLEEMRRLLDEEMKEKEKIFSIKPKYMKLKNEFNDYDSINSTVDVDDDIIDERKRLSIGTVEKLKLSLQLANRKPSSKTNFTKKQLKVNKNDTKYTTLIKKTDNHSYSNKYIQYDQCNNKDTKYHNKKISTAVRIIRVLNIDKLPLEILHHMVAYNLVKNLPAEKVIRIIWRIASYRDKRGDVAYQNLHLDVGNALPESCRAEMVALLSRAHQTISIPFLVDYVRKFGTFSRGYIARTIDKCAKPRLFDFIRFARFGGTKKLPLVLTQPRTLMGYVNLFKNCSAKMYMENNLKLLGLIPNSYKFEKYHAYGTLDEKLAHSLLQSERLLTDPELPENDYKSDDQNRPLLYDLITKSQSLNIPIEDLLEDNFVTNPILSKYAKSETTTDENVTSSFISSQLIPLVPKESNVTDNNRIDNGGHGYKNVDSDIPIGGKRTWSLPWTVINNSFTYKGKKYVLSEGGWQIENNMDERNWYKRSSREIRRKYSRKLTLKRMAMKLSRVNSNCF